MGMLLAVMVHPANVQDRDGAEPLLRQARRLFPFVERIIGDAGYQGPKMAAAVARTGTWKIEIVRRSDKTDGLKVLTRRWVVVGRENQDETSATIRMRALRQSG